MFYVSGKGYIRMIINFREIEIWYCFKIGINIGKISGLVVNVFIDVDFI